MNPTLPFSPSSGFWVGAPNSNVDVIGVLEAEKNGVDLMGSNETSFLYSEPMETALDDLSVRVGLFQCGANSVGIPIGAENALTQISCVPEPNAYASFMCAVVGLTACIRNRRSANSR